MTTFTQSNHRRFRSLSPKQVFNRIEGSINQQLLKQTLTSLLGTSLTDQFFSFQSKNKSLSLVSERIDPHSSGRYLMLTVHRPHPSMLTYTMENSQKRASIIFKLLKV